MQIQKSNILDKILHFHRDIIDNHNIKKNSEDFTWKDLDNELELFGVNTVKNSLIENDKVHNTVIKSCDYIKLNSKIIENKSVYYNLKLKIILTFGIRILLEKQMIMILEKNNIKIDWTKKLTTNQLHSKLRKLDKNINGKYDINLRQKVNKSLTLTNQVIHINSFMYEPLIDLDIQDLIKLYSESQIY